MPSLANWLLEMNDTNYEARNISLIFLFTLTLVCLKAKAILLSNSKYATALLAVSVVHGYR
jgi:hypothetical protein